MFGASALPIQKIVKKLPLPSAKSPGEKIGVEIELVRGQDAEQINLALTSGEPIDLLNYNNVAGQLATIVRNNWRNTLDDLVEKYGQGARSNQSCGFGCLSVRRRSALPDMKDTSRSAGFSMRKDIVDALGKFLNGHLR